MFSSSSGNIQISKLNYSVNHNLVLFYTVHMLCTVYQTFLSCYYFPDKPHPNVFIPQIMYFSCQCQLCSNYPLFQTVFNPVLFCSEQFEVLRIRESRVVQNAELKGSCLLRANTHTLDEFYVLNERSDKVDLNCSLCVCVCIL